MISYERALAIVRERTAGLPELEDVGLADSLGRVLARPIVANRPNPAFDNSAVDGYLLGAPSASAGDRFDLKGEIRAGSLPPFASPGPHEDVRIFTGAPVPEGTFCVAMQEDVLAEASHIVLRADVRESAAIRCVGADFDEGTELAPAGKRIGAAEIALAAWCGMESVQVVRRLRIGICVTGDELVPPGKELALGQIHDSNSPMLQALCAPYQPESVVARVAGDSSAQTAEVLRELAQATDFVIVSGGASVGDYDHVPASVAELGEVFFHGISVKPGKPTLFGKIGGAIVFGLPGNPASAYVCFQLFVRPALRLLGGEIEPREVWTAGRYEARHSAAPRDEFVRVRLDIDGDILRASPVHEQGSFGLRSLSAAHALARLEKGRSYAPGDPVSCLILPHAN
jgi:molybdopterin molybdotransferase